MKFYLALAITACVLAVSAAEPRRSRSGDNKKVHYVDQKLKSNKTRQGKVFSLFNVVTFDNGPCASSSSISSGGSGGTHRNGTCFTESECRDKKGTASGNCAAGFGVCCVFMVEKSGTTINQNCTYIRNPNFPSALTETSNIQYTVDKCDNAVCGLRLDFESFTILGTGNTGEVSQDATGTANGFGACQDTFTATVSTGQNIPIICGQNTGQHMYLDLGRGDSDSANLQFSFDGNQATTMRQWEIKVTQVKCGMNTFPNGCLQYLTGVTGVFSTFNFIPTNDNHLFNQDYSICIRQEAGFCCIQYLPCNEPDSFSITDIGLAAGMSGTGSQCSLDYIGIEGSSATCGQASSNNLNNKYCGARLSVTNGVDATAAPPDGNDVVCDCTAPFSVSVYTDAKDDSNPATAALAADNVMRSRGVCLTYMQVPCGHNG